MDKIPCIKCNSKLWKYIKPYLKEWGYGFGCIGEFKKYQLLIINYKGCEFCTNVHESEQFDYNRELVNNVEEFLERAAKLKGFTYKRKDIMKTNDLIIIPPEGMETYQEGNKIKFRHIKKANTLQEIYKHLFANKDVWRMDGCGVINKYPITPNWNFYTNCTSEKQAQKLIAINKLMNVAKYLNGDWEPDWNDNSEERKFYIYISKNSIANNIIKIDYIYNNNPNIVYFKSEELAKKAIEILGEEIIKIALSTDW